MKNPADIKAFGVHLRRLRDEKNLSQQELADLADVAKITIQRIENAKFIAGLDTMISIAKAMKIPIEELVAYKHKRNG